VVRLPRANQFIALEFSISRGISFFPSRVASIKHKQFIFCPQFILIRQTVDYTPTRWFIHNLKFIRIATSEDFEWNVSLKVVYYCFLSECILSSKSRKNFHPDSQDSMQSCNIVTKIHSLKILVTNSWLSAL